MVQQSAMKLGFVKPAIPKNSAAQGLFPSDIIVKKSLPRPSRAFDTYWKFAFLRQEAFFNRIANPHSFSWTNDPIIRRYRFTNVYRASDRVSQFLIRNVLYDEKWTFEDTVFRTFLFKIFNKIETWNILEGTLGELRWEPGILDSICKVLDQHFANGVTIYSAAYIMPSPSRAFGRERKHQNHVELIRCIMSPENLGRLRGVNSFEALYQHILAFPGIGGFLAYQYAIDLNYSSYFNFSENDFVVPGPGAKDGIRKCFADLGDFSFEDVIKFMKDSQGQAFEAMGLGFQSLWGRPLMLIDCQNLFCEVDKYCRVAFPDLLVGAGRTRIKQSYKCNPKPIEYFFPPKWSLEVTQQR